MPNFLADNNFCVLLKHVTGRQTQPLAALKALVPVWIAKHLVHLALADLYTPAFDGNVITNNPWLAWEVLVMQCAVYQPVLQQLLTFRFAGGPYCGALGMPFGRPYVAISEETTQTTIRETLETVFKAIPATAGAIETWPEVVVLKREHQVGLMPMRANPFQDLDTTIRTRGAEYRVALAMYGNQPNGVGHFWVHRREGELFYCVDDQKEGVHTVKSLMDQRGCLIGVVLTKTDVTEYPQNQAEQQGCEPGKQRGAKRNKRGNEPDHVPTVRSLPRSGPSHSGRGDNGKRLGVTVGSKSPSEVDAAPPLLDAPCTTSPSAVAAADPISWWFEAEGADAKVQLTAEIGTELENWCHPGSGRYLLLGEGVEDGMAKDHALRVYMLQQDETYDKRDDLVTKYSNESELTYSDHFSPLATQPTFTTTEGVHIVKNKRGNETDCAKRDLAAMEKESSDSDGSTSSGEEFRAVPFKYTRTRQPRVHAQENGGPGSRAPGGSTHSLAGQGEAWHSKRPLDVKSLAAHAKLCDSKRHPNFRSPEEWELYLKGIRKDIEATFSNAKADRDEKDKTHRQAQARQQQLAINARQHEQAKITREAERQAKFGAFLQQNKAYVLGVYNKTFLSQTVCSLGSGGDWQTAENLMLTNVVILNVMKLSKAAASSYVCARIAQDLHTYYLTHGASGAGAVTPP